MVYDPFIESSMNSEQNFRTPGVKQMGKKISRNAGESEDESPEEPGLSPEIATIEEFIQALENAYKTDKNLQIKLLYIALGKIRYFCFSDEVNGHTADDVVQNVMELILIGRRKWNKTKFPDVVHYLIVVIHSYIRNESKKKPDWISEDIYDEDGKLREDKIEKFQREAITAEEQYTELHKEKLEDLLNELTKRLEAKDEEAYCVLDEILKNDILELGDAQLAKLLGMELKEFKLAKRRIRYNAEQIIKNKLK